MDVKDIRPRTGNNLALREKVVVDYAIKLCHKHCFVEIQEYYENYLSNRKMGKE